MKRFIAIFVGFVAACILSGCTGPLSISLSPYNVKVDQEFSFFTGLEVKNDFDGVIDAFDRTKWEFVVESDNLQGHLHTSGSFWYYDAPGYGTVYAIYDRNGRNIRTNTVPINVSQKN